MLGDANILLGISGSIAAYKAAFLTRLLVKAGANVRVVMTEPATTFITPLTLSTLSRNPVTQSFVRDEQTGEWDNHVELGLWADLMVIAPASANTLAKMANGICDNVMMAAYLSAKCPVYVAPAMDLDMFKHPTTQQNLEKITSFGNKIISPGSGELASGLVGEGRMAEPEEIIDYINEELKKAGEFYGKKVLISAGPTHEPIDPVRFIGNRSSGKMGFALAEEAAKRGADVTLITGPVNLETTSANIQRINVETAAEMYEACIDAFEGVDIAIMAAAVADYRPVNPADQKIKKEKGGEERTLELEGTKDILKELGARKKHQTLVGFALETNDAVKHAKAKLEKKNLDLIVLNSLEDEGAGFGHSTNKVTLIDRQNNLIKFKLKSKSEVAEDILNAINKLL